MYPHLLTRYSTEEIARSRRRPSWFRRWDRAPLAGVQRPANSGPGAGGAFLCSWLGAATFGGRALRGKAAAGSLDCRCPSGASARPGGGPEGRWSRGQCPEVSAPRPPPWAVPSAPCCCPSPPRRVAVRRAGNLGPWGSGRANRPRKGERRCFIAQPFKKRCRSAKCLRVGSFIFILTTLRR